MTPAKRGKGGVTPNKTEKVVTEYSMTWAERLKRVFNIDVTTCSRCGGSVRIIACIEDPIVIKKILAHVDALQQEPVDPSLCSRLLLLDLADKYLLRPLVLSDCNSNR